MRYGLIGEKLGHCFSKFILEQLGVFSYDLFALSSVVLDAFVRE